MKCGLLGAKLGHSYSPQIHSHLGEYDYFLYEKSKEELDDFLTNGDFSGLNVTIPYKKAVIPYCRELTSVARKLGAVNTVIRQADGSLLGHNTDYFGFETMLLESKLDVAGKKVLVLGSGGASKTVVAVLESHGAQPVVISRSGPDHYGNVSRHSDAAVMVNTTPVGMYPNNGVSPVDLERFPHLEGVLDLIYNPARTQLLMDAEKRNLVAMNGLLMLVAQGWEAAQRFTGSAMDRDKIPVIFRDLQQQMENIILIGMPGSGKSTVGKLLAQETRKQFVDADEYLEQKAGLPIPKIIETQGIDSFRVLETQVLQELGKSSGLVIATGGGCVTREENYPLLRQNGRIFCLERDISKLPTDGRPVSQSTPLEELYRIRKPLYSRFADHTVDCNAHVQQAVTDILNIWEEKP